ncbi:MAG: hypothetical protein GXP19_00130 [Gammaproteobacteria bacterium]|nr:hypothetical protein [Gammaproteobacteria bacterium]
MHQEQSGDQKKTGHQEHTDNKLYIMPTPSGAYYAVSRPVPDPSRKLLTSILQCRQSPLLTLDDLKTWTGSDSNNEAMALLNSMQMRGWLQGLESSQRAPAEALEDILPDFLAALSVERKALLADHQGFYLASCGFEQRTVDELSALTADLASLQERHLGLLSNNLDLQTSAWALVDAAGNSQIGFWPLYIGQHRFVLVIGGMPCLNQPELTRLIWALSVRYSTPD